MASSIKSITKPVRRVNKKVEYPEINDINNVTRYFNHLVAILSDNNEKIPYFIRMTHKLNRIVEEFRTFCNQDNQREVVYTAFKIIEQSQFVSSNMRQVAHIAENSLLYPSR